MDENLFNKNVWGVSQYIRNRGEITFYITVPHDLLTLRKVVPELCDVSIAKLRQAYPIPAKYTVQDVQTTIRELAQNAKEQGLRYAETYSTDVSYLPIKVDKSVVMLIENGEEAQKICQNMLDNGAQIIEIIEDD